VIIDTHCHLNFNLFKDDLDDVLARARSVGVGRIVVPAIDLQTCAEVIELSQRYSEIYATIGIHPNEAANFSLKEVDKLHDFAQNAKVVAIGEIGLDKYHDDVGLNQQIFAFEAQVDLAKDLNLPVLVHNREADTEIENILSKAFGQSRSMDGSQNQVGIMHAFSSSLDFAEFVIKLGFSVGAAGPITFKNAEVRRQVFAKIDKNNIVLETDAPFLSPHPFRGKRNEPAFSTYIAEELSRIWNLPLNDVVESTTRNAARIFQWTNLK
jgi:TatD DNase family protein